jgi:ABC-type protease/lipase transport system fused ATPase/permease subunit
MDTNKAFNLTVFTSATKQICMCSATSIFLIILFIISPLSNFFKTSLFMKLIALIILVYTIYLNNKQTNSLRDASSMSTASQIKSQLNINIICSYVFTIFIGLLIIFIIKSFF